MTKKDHVIAGSELVEALRHPERLGELSLKGWDMLLRVARRANLLGRLADGVRKTDFFHGLPAPVRNQLDSAAVLTAHQREAIGWETEHIARALAPVGGAVILLKGAAYVLSGRAAAIGRMFGDVDILVPPEALAATEAALMTRGWASGHLDSYDEHYYRRWMHEIPPMTHRERGTVIDVHHNILPSTTRTMPDAQLLRDASEPIAGSMFRVLCPVDMLIHSAVHLFHESELQNGLRDLFDLDALLREFSGQSTDFWRKLVERAIQLDQVLPVFLALRYTKAILASDVPGEISFSLEKASGLGPFGLAALDAVYLRALMPDHPLGNDLPTSLARAAVFLRGHYLRMPVGLLTLHLTRKFFLRLFRNTSRSL